MKPNIDNQTPSFQNYFQIVGTWFTPYNCYFWKREGIVRDEKKSKKRKLSKKLEQDCGVIGRNKEGN